VTPTETVTPTPTKTVAPTETVTPTETPTHTEEPTEKPTVKPWNTTDSGISKATNGLLSIEVAGENEVVIGESTESIIGGRNEFCAVAAMQASFLGVFECHVPDEVKVHNRHGEIGLNKIRADVDRTIIAAADQYMMGKEVAVTGEASHVITARLDAVADSTQHALSSVRALGQSTGAHAQTMRTLGTNMQLVNQQRRALGTVMQNQGAVLESAGDSLITAGARMETNGTAVNEASADLLETSGVHLENAAVFFEGH
jgi:hypothetical protein